MTPGCRACGKLLDRVDRVATEHLTHDATTGEYRPLHSFEGLASDTFLACGYCAIRLPIEQRQFFYRRWNAIPKEMRG